MNALLSIDYTVDFVADTGRLTTGQAGQAIETTLVDHTQRFIDQGDFVVFAIDRHEAEDPYHPENQLFPPHNLAGSEGRNLYGTLAAVYEDHKEKKMFTGSISATTRRLVGQILTFVYGNEALLHFI